MIKRQNRIKENITENKYNDINYIRDIVRDEFNKFMNYIFIDNTILFQDFLERTSKYFDTFIQDISRKEQLNFIAGKFLMKKGGSTVIHLTAEFYFQNATQQWILKKKEGNIDSCRFDDWKKAPELKQLQREKKLEYAIDPPEQNEVI